MKKKKKKEILLSHESQRSSDGWTPVFFTFLLFTIGCTVKEISKLSLSSSTFMQQLEL